MSRLYQVAILPCPSSFHEEEVELAMDAEEAWVTQKIFQVAEHLENIKEHRLLQPDIIYFCTKHMRHLIPIKMSALSNIFPNVIASSNPTIKSILKTELNHIGVANLHMDYWCNFVDVLDTLDLSSDCYVGSIYKIEWYKHKNQVIAIIYM